MPRVRSVAAIQTNLPAASRQRLNVIGTLAVSLFLLIPHFLRRNYPDAYCSFWQRLGKVTSPRSILVYAASVLSTVILIAFEVWRWPELQERLNSPLLQLVASVFVVVGTLVGLFVISRRLAQ